MSRSSAEITTRSGRLPLALASARSPSEIEVTAMPAGWMARASASARAGSLSIKRIVFSPPPHGQESLDPSTYARHPRLSRLGLAGEGGPLAEQGRRRPHAADPELVHGAGDRHVEQAAR